MFSDYCISFAREKGWFNGKDEDFSFCETYAYPDFSGRRFCEARVWSFFNHFSDDMERYLPYAEGKVKDAEPMPLWIVPNRKVTLQDMRDCMRDHYEGTPFALDNDPGQGLWGMPYRPTPLTFKVDGKEYFNERPTSTQQSGFSYIAQLRSWLPRQVGGILWFGNDDGNMVAYTPVYCGNTVQPECYNTPGADAVTFSDRNAYWVCNWVSNMVYPRYSMMFGSLKEVRDSLEASYDAAQAAVEAEAVRLCGTDEAEAVRYLNAYSNDKAQQMLARWKVKDAEPMPLWIVPNRTVTLQDMRDCMRDHYEGTPFALDNDPGQGLWGMPYRPTPLTFKVDGKEYFNERPTSTQQSGFSYIAQLRSWLPRQVGGILWFGNDDGNMVAYTPVYCGNTVQPECYNTPGADAVTFSDRNAYWVCNWVSNMVYPRYSMMFGSLKEVRDSLEASYDAAQAAVEAEAVRLCGTDEAEAVRYLNAYSNDKAQQMLARWKELAVYLIVKYNDMTVKPEENGRFKRTATGLGATVERPGYTDKAAREIVKAAGDRYAVPEQ